MHTPATDWKDDGDNHWKECECGKELLKAEHTYVLDETTVKTPTCTEEGYTGDEVCECGGIIKGEPIETIEHTHVLDETTVKTSTCTEEGYTGDKVCECGDTVKGDLIEKAPHHHVLDQSTVKTPTHTEEGYTGDEICECGDIIKGKVMNKIPNSPITGDDSDILLWGMLLALSAAGIGLLVLIKKIKKV